MTLYLAGGAPSPALGDLLDSFVEDVQKRGTRVAIALLGSEQEAGERLEAYASPITSRYPKAEIEPIWLTDTDEGEIVWPAEPEYLAGLVVGAGWTPGYLEALSGYREMISTLVRRGVPYLGWSAGARIAGRYVLAGGWQYQGRQLVPEFVGEGSTQLDIRDGLALVGTAIEVHADTQFLLGRALASVQSGPIRSVACIDETAALVVEVPSGRSTVYGHGQVTWAGMNDHGFNVRFDPSTTVSPKSS